MAQQQTIPTQDQSLPISAPASGRQNRHALLWEVGLLSAVLLLALLLRLWHLAAVTNNYDEGVYWSSLRAMYHGDGLFTTVFSSQPPFFLLSLYPLVALFGPTQLAARLGVVGFSLIGILAMYLLARRLGGPWTAFGAALLLAGDYLFLLQSQTIDAEVPSVALLLVAVAAAAYADRYPWQAALLSGAATALALLEKLFAVVAFAPILMLFASDLIAFERSLPFSLHWMQPAGVIARLRAIHRQTLWHAAVLLGAYLGGLALATLLVLLPYHNQLGVVYQQVIAFHLAADQSYADVVSQNPLILLSAITEYPLILLALAGIILGLKRRRRHIRTAAIWALVALVILLRQAPLFPHHLVLLLPALALSAAIGLTPAPETLSAELAALRAWLQRRRPGWNTRASKVLLIGIPILLLSGTLLFNLQEMARHPLDAPAREMEAAPINAPQIAQVVRDLTFLTTPRQQVITDDQYIVALANRNTPPALVDTSEVRINTGYLTTQQVISIAEQPQIGAVLFYTGRLDMLPGFRAWVEQHFYLARSYDEGQDLYLRAAT